MKQNWGTPGKLFVGYGFGDEKKHNPAMWGLITSVKH